VMSPSGGSDTGPSASTPLTFGLSSVRVTSGSRVAWQSGMYCSHGVPLPVVGVGVSSGAGVVEALLRGGKSENGDVLTRRSVVDGVDVGSAAHPAKTNEINKTEPANPHLALCRIVFPRELPAGLEP
jgi:hypothetical protein